MKRSRTACKMCGQHVKWLEQPDGTHYLANIPGFEKHKCEKKMTPNQAIERMVAISKQFENTKSLSDFENTKSLSDFENSLPPENRKIFLEQRVDELEYQVMDLQRSIDIIVQIIERTK